MRKNHRKTKDPLAARITYVRENLLEMTQEQLADALGVKRGAVGNWELAGRPSSKNFERIADLAKVDLQWLMRGTGTPPSTLSEEEQPPGVIPVSNAQLGRTASLRGTIPVYGQAVGGKDGCFVLNGNKVADVIAPPSLTGVPDAYAVYVVGTSMSPRYEPGECVYVNPRLPIRAGDYVVVQIANGEGEPPNGYIKRYVSQDNKLLKLDQLNPPKHLTFPTNKVVSIHRIIMGGQG